MTATGVIWIRKPKPGYEVPVPAAAAQAHTITSSIAPGAAGNANIFLSSRGWEREIPGGNACSLFGKSNIVLLDRSGGLVENIIYNEGGMVVWRRG